MDHVGDLSRPSNIYNNQPFVFHELPCMFTTSRSNLIFTHKSKCLIIDHVIQK